MESLLSSGTGSSAEPSMYRECRGQSCVKSMRLRLLCRPQRLQVISFLGPLANGIAWCWMMVSGTFGFSTWVPLPCEPAALRWRMWFGTCFAVGRLWALCWKTFILRRMRPPIPNGRRCSFAFCSVHIFHANQPSDASSSDNVCDENRPGHKPADNEHTILDKSTGCLCPPASLGALQSHASKVVPRSADEGVPGLHVRCIR